MKTRLMSVLGVLAVSVALVGGPWADEAVAQRYPPSARRCTVGVNRHNGRLTIRVFCPRLGINIVINVRLFSDPVDLGNFTTNAQGDLDVTVTVPESVEPGSHNLRLFRVSPSPATGVQASPATGVTATPQVGDHGTELDSIPLTLKGTGEDRKVLIGSAPSVAATPAAGRGSSTTASLTVVSIGLAGIGAAGIIMARRRRDPADEGTA